MLQEPKLVFQVRFNMRLSYLISTVFYRLNGLGQTFQNPIYGNATVAAPPAEPKSGIMVHILILR